MRVAVSSDTVIFFLYGRESGVLHYIIPSFKQTGRSIEVLRTSQGEKIYETSQKVHILLKKC